MSKVKSKVNATSRMTCPNEGCAAHGKLAQGNVARHGYSRVKRGRRRRYRCSACGKTFGATTGTPYKRRMVSSPASTA